MDPTAQALLIGAISGGIVAVLTNISKSVIDNRSSNTTAKQSDLNRVEAGYSKLQETYEKANAALGLQIVEERTARRADRLECERQIDALRMQVVELTRKLPEPGAVAKVVIVGADIPKDSEGKPIAALPVVIAGPVPLPTTVEERRAAAAAVAAIVEQAASEKEK